MEAMGLSLRREIQDVSERAQEQFITAECGYRFDLVKNPGPWSLDT
jgi:hypothetical protein